MLAVADWWLVVGEAFLFAAAAPPARIMANAMMRMTSSMEGNLWWIWIVRKHISCTPKS
jgi:hypothetical protein